MEIQPVFKYRVPVHIAGWILFFAVPMLLSPSQDFAAVFQEPGQLYSLAIRNILWIALFYLNLGYVTPSLLKKQITVLYLLTLIIAVLAVTLINSRVHHLFIQPFPGGPPPSPEGQPPGAFGQPPFGPRRPMGFGPPGPFISNLVISVMVASVSTSLVLWSEWLKARAEEQERAFQKVASELAILKLQISPHFLFNTLNNIRWLIRSASDQAEASVVKLSSLLRYVLYQTEFEKVPLDKEAEHLQDYVALQKMRLVNTESVLFSTEGIQPGQQIVPLLLIPLVENVFKYGEFGGDHQHKINLEVKNDLLLFRTSNKVAAAVVKTGKDYGIGLANVRRRLALHYPHRHVLKTEETNGIFELQLEIILN